MEIAMTARTSALLLGGAIGAIAVAGSWGRADAQAFDATPKTVAGTVSYDRATPGVETVTIDSQSAIINWTPTSPGNPYVFLPAGNVATFTNGASTSDFAVLNRILTNNPVRFDGSVISQIQDAALGTSHPGGTIVFEAPGGIIVSSTAVFDIGNLVLTTLATEVDVSNNFIDPAGGIHFFAGDKVAGAAITIQPGAHINALNQGSYIAMLSPLITQGGAVRINGSVAYIAGEEVHLRVNQGLFDIIVDTGTANAIPLVHTGSTGGPASTGAADVHNIYLVAVPKNQAITAVLQGDIGFDPAVNAAVENGAIILSAGYNVGNGQVDRYGDFVPAAPVKFASNFEIRGGTIRSDLFGFATGSMLASGQATGKLAFLQDVHLFGVKSAQLFAGTSQIVTVAGNAFVSSSMFRTTDPAQFNLGGGQALAFAQNGGSLTINGNLTLDASAVGIVDQVNSIAGTGTGGTASLFADGGTVRVDGSVNVLATGDGATIDFAPNSGGAGTGGPATVQALNGGSLSIGGNLAVNTTGTGSRISGNLALAGATGRGGDIALGATGGGTVTITGATTLTSNGTGGPVLTGAGNAGGTGQGGTIRIAAGGTVSFGGASSFSANGFGGVGPVGGAGLGGKVLIDATLGQITFGGTAELDAIGIGGDAGGAPGGRGGDATGGQVSVTAHSGAAAGRITGGALGVNVNGFGGKGGLGTLGTPTGRGGDGRGGSAALLAEAANGSLQFGALTASARGFGGLGGDADADGNGGRGGDGFGGTLQAGTTSGPTAATLTGSTRFASADLNASATGGTGGAGGGAGGTATGGSAALVSAGAPTIVAGNATLAADATGGAGGPSVAAGGPTGALGTAHGGQVLLSVANHAISGAPGALSAGNITGTASATGAAGTGNSPGEWHVTAAGGTMTFANLTLTALATGAPAVRPFSSIEPQGGVITISQTGTLTTAGEIRVIGSGAGRIAGGRLNLIAGDDVTMTHASPVPGGFTVDMSDFFVTAGDDFSAGAGVVTRASNQTDIRAVDQASVAGRLLGRDVLLGSADIDIAASGGIGDAATESVTLLVAPLSTPGAGQFTVLGGTTQGPGYTLTNAEAARIRAGTLHIQTPQLALAANRPPDLIVRDLTFVGGGAATGIGILDINTRGIARVEGALAMTGAAAANGISVTADQRLEVVTPTGSIRVRDGAGNPGGTMSLTSANIWVASAGIIDKLRIDPNYAGRDDELIDNGGVDAPLGYVEADAVRLGTGGTLYIQNTTSARGTFASGSDFGGVTVGPGGLIIRSTGTPGSVNVFGRRRNADGSFTIGDDFFHSASYLTGGAPLTSAYTLGSMLNTCIIVTGACAIKAPLNPIPGAEPTIGPTGGSVAILLPGGGARDDLVDTSFASDPLIEEPVTSGSEGNGWDCPDENRDGQCDTPHD
jgi:hypothetical protein